MNGCVSEWKFVNEISESQWKYMRVGWWEWLGEQGPDTEYEDELTSDSMDASRVSECESIGWVGMFGWMVES